jgi:hypothetical protein
MALHSLFGVHYLYCLVPGYFLMSAGCIVDCLSVYEASDEMYSRL